MSFYQIALTIGPALAALLVLHHIIGAKIDNEAILTAYRELRQDAGRRKATSQSGETQATGTNTHPAAASAEPYND